MRILRQFTSVFLILLAITAICYAQEDVLRPKSSNVSHDEADSRPSTRSPFIIGIEGGLNYNMFSRTMTWATPVPNSMFNTFSTGSGLSPFFSALVDFSLTDKLGLQFKLSYDIKNFNNKYTGIGDGSIPATGERADVSYSWEYNSTGAYLGISAQLRYYITDNLMLIAGPIIQLSMGTFEQSNTYTVLSPGFYWDLTTQQTVRTDKSTIPSPKTRIGLEAGLGYKISLSKKVFLVPQARFQFMPTKISDDESVIDGTRVLFGSPQLDAKNSMLNSLQFALAFWFEV